MISAARHQLDDYVAVPVSMIFPSQAVGVSLYVRYAPDDPLQLYRGADYPFEVEDLKRLMARGIKNLYVAGDEHSRYQQHMRKNLANVVRDEAIPVKCRFLGLNEVIRDILKEVFEAHNTEAAIDQSKQLGGHVVELICRKEMVVADLFQMLYHDFDTFTHSANVTYYCVLLAHELGISDRRQLDAIAAAGLLHDIGKLELPDSILNKPGKLTAAEFEQVKRHPTAGFTKLAGRGDLSFGQLMMVYQHHERLDGSGYPVGASGEEIHPWARLCGVVDVFEAVTSDRPYRKRMPVAEAVSLLEPKAGICFDESILRCWKAITRSC